LGASEKEPLLLLLLLVRAPLPPPPTPKRRNARSCSLSLFTHFLLCVAAAPPASADSKRTTMAGSVGCSSSAVMRTCVVFVFCVFFLRQGGVCRSRSLVCSLRFSALSLARLSLTLRRALVPDAATAASDATPSGWPAAAAAGAGVICDGRRTRKSEFFF
jgi:hypothetical protein